MVKILIFSGTSDGRILSEKLAAAGAEVTVSVATDYGQEEQATVEGVAIHKGRVDREAMVSMMAGYDLVVDATHPYAAEVTKNIRWASEESGTPLKRLARDSASLNTEEALWVKSPEEAVEVLSGMEGRILLTTGSKDLPIYASLGGERLVARVLPTLSSLEACEAAEIPHRNIIAMQGPFREDLNQALIRQFDIDIMVTKESGKAGGFAEKVRAAAELGVRTIVIARPEDEGQTMESILDDCRSMM